MSSAFEPSITPEMRTRYLARRRDDFAALDEALVQKDFAKMCAVAHQIKGNAATFSFDELEELAIALEGFAEQQVVTSCTETIARMHAWLTREQELVASS